MQTIRRELDEFHGTVAVILCSVRSEWWYEVEVGVFGRGETVRNDGMFPTPESAFAAALEWIAGQVEERPCVLGLPPLQYDYNGNLSGPYTGAEASIIPEVPLPASVMRNLAQTYQRESRTPPGGV